MVPGRGLTGFVAVVLCLLAQLVAITEVQAVEGTGQHLTARRIGLIINRQDPYSSAVGEYYAKVRKVPPENIVMVDVPVKAVLSLPEFEELSRQVNSKMPAAVQAYAIAWTEPYAVECNAITSALGWRFQGNLCKQTCAASDRSPYFNSGSTAPFDELGIRPSMLLASRSIAEAQRMIDRGLASDRTLSSRIKRPAQAIYVQTADGARNVRARLYPYEPFQNRVQVRIVDRAHERAIDEAAVAQRVVLYQIGATHVDHIRTLDWVPGALADHLTSYGGLLLSTGGQMSALDWLEGGATASYGTVSEPCNHLEKFPHPVLLLKHYVSGVTAVEAYWRSVAWPAQGVFVGDPLASPFAGGQ